MAAYPLALQHVYVPLLQLRASGVRPSLDKPLRGLADSIYGHEVLVDLSGLEPLTLCLQSSCSTNWSYKPSDLLLTFYRKFCRMSTSIYDNMLVDTAGIEPATRAV